MKLSDVYRMYGSGGHHQGSGPASHGRSFAIDAALAGACEVPTLSVCLLLLCLGSLLAFPCHVAPSAGVLLIKPYCTAGFAFLIHEPVVAAAIFCLYSHHSITVGFIRDD